MISCIRNAILNLFLSNYSSLVESMLFKLFRSGWLNYHGRTCKFCLIVMLSECTEWYSNWEDQVDWFHMKKRVNCVLLCMQHWLLQNVLYFNTKLSMVDFNKKNRVNLGSLYMHTLHVIIHESADLDLCSTHTYLVLEWLYTYTFLEQPGKYDI